MAYLNLDPNYFEHPKTRRLVGLIGDKAEIYPIRLWCYCSKYHPENGRFINYSSEEIEAILHWNGEKNLLVNSMTKVGFLNKKGAHYEVNDWKEHEGHIINYKKRSQIAAKARWDRIKTRSNATSNAKNNPKHPILNQNQALPTLPYLQDKRFAENFEEYLEMRKKIRKPATERAKELVLKKLHKYPIETAIAMLEKSIVSSWVDVYEIKNYVEQLNTQNPALLTQAKQNLSRMAKPEDIAKWMRQLSLPEQNKLRLYLLTIYPKDADKAWGEAEVIYKRVK